jgi:hypothetical protein
MHRYILFAGKRRPAGGFDDYVGSRNSVDALKKLALTCHVGGNGKAPHWADIIDLTTMGRLWSYRDGEWLENNIEPSNSWSDTS